MGSERRVVLFPGGAWYLTTGDVVPMQLLTRHVQSVEFYIGIYRQSSSLLLYITV